MRVSVFVMNRKECIKEIIQTLLESNPKTDCYSRGDIEKAIMICRGLDHRTIKNWFGFLFRLEYFTQPKPGVFELNTEKVATL